MKSNIPILAAVLAGLVAVSACTHFERVPLTGRDHPSGWSNEIRATAEATYEYAQMANNAYADAREFDLGPDLVLIDEMDNDDIGFAYAVFERRSDGRVSEIIIAYRGTEFGFPDLWYGTALGRQNERGLAVYDSWRAMTDPEIAISVTGHSLGGGIATHVSLCRHGVDTYVFNSSPRFWRCSREAVKNRRFSVAEHGEFLKLGRIFGREATQTYASVGCTNRANPVTQHSIRRLADCLTRIAAWVSHEARNSARRNGLPVPPQRARDDR